MKLNKKELVLRGLIESGRISNAPQDLKRTERKALEQATDVHIYRSFLATVQRNTK